MPAYSIVERKLIILQDTYILCIAQISQEMNFQRMIFRNFGIINNFQQAQLTVSQSINYVPTTSTFFLQTFSIRWLLYNTQ